MTPLFTILRPHPTLKTGLYCISVEDRDGYPAKIALEILKNDKTARIAGGRSQLNFAKRELNRGE